MVFHNKVSGNCILCRTKLDDFNTKVIENPKYLKYRNLVCNICFDEYYPLYTNRNNKGG